MRRVVITGLGIISCLGVNKKETLSSLSQQKSGIRYNDEYKKHQLRSHISGRPLITVSDHIDKPQLRFMSDSSAYAYLSLKEAIDDAKLDTSHIQNTNTGIVAGSGGASCANIVQSIDTQKKRGIRRMGPYCVTKTMGSSVSANLATSFGIQGVNYSLTSACATSAHCIGHGAELIQFGKQNIVFAGGAEDEHWTQAALFDAMGALSTQYNETPETASRPYDTTRDGFVIAGGGGMLVLEEYEHAKRRGASIYAEIVGYGATSDGENMVAPSYEGAVRCMNIALSSTKKPIDYINTHGTSTPLGDVSEIKAIKQVFKKIPAFSSTKSLTGHPLGAAGVHEAIYTLLMMESNFITGSVNISQCDPDAQNLPLITKNTDQRLTCAMSNSFGFGGTNASLIFQTL